MKEKREVIIIRENINLPPHEIKRKIREYNAKISNDEIEKLILQVLMRKAKNRQVEKQDFYEER